MRLAFWLMANSQVACEIAAASGYEIVLIDLEHGAFDVKDLDRLVPFSKGVGLTVYARVSAPERVPVQHALDFGADGVILPQIRDAAHAETVTAFAKYPPLGSRGMGFSRTQGYAGVGDDFTAAENMRTLCFPMIETPTALAEAEAIAALPTVDGLFVGPSDLALTSGRGQNGWRDEDIADIEKAAEAAKRADKWFATTGAESPVARAMGEKAGADFMSAGDDLSALMLGFGALMNMARGES
jgi:2-dehydro-3-deoxyglucarate aldolase/4-hydroxy-2-oxoheptanedioate aldolase